MTLNITCHGSHSIPLQLLEYSKDSGVEVESEGEKLEELLELPLEEVEVSELPLEGVLDEVLGWKEHRAVLEITGRDSG